MRARRPWCAEAGAKRQRSGGPPSWSHTTEDRLNDFADELSHETLAQLSVIAAEYGLIATSADILDAHGALSARLVLAEPRYPHAEDMLGLIVLARGAEPGDGLLFTRPRG